MSFTLYLVGLAIFIGGMAWALITAGMSHLYAMIGCVILLGLGILTGVTRTHDREPSQ